MKYTPPADPAGSKRVSREFVAAFETCRRIFGWEGDELEEMRTWCRHDAQARWYIEQRAVAHHDFYVQHAGNEFWRLDAYRDSVGLPPLDQAWKHLTEATL